MNLLTGFRIRTRIKNERLGIFWNFYRYDGVSIVLSAVSFKLFTKPMQQSANNKQTVDMRECNGMFKTYYPEYVYNARSNAYLCIWIKLRSSSAVIGF
jgi:hypothetical protein